MPAAPLTASQVDALTTIGVHRVDHGLYLQIKPNGARSWLLRYQLNGRPRQMGLGPERLVGLTDARRRALKAQRQLLDGIDPIETRRAERAESAPAATADQDGVPTFAEAARLYIAAHEAGWKNDKHIAQWSSTIKMYADPVIGSMPVNEIGVDHVVKVLRPIWLTKSETASRLRGRLERVLDWARAKRYREGDNPARWKGALSHLLPPLKKRPTHHKAMPYAEVPDFMGKLRRLDSTSARALEFTILTAARTGEVIGARWSEIDLDQGVWTVPGDRMKAGREHRVPLAPDALELLRALRRTSAEDGFVFTGAKPSKPLSNMAMTMVLRGLGCEATVHGFRSSFSDWASEETDYPRDVREMALAHTIQNKAEAAYRRGDLLDKRRPMMVDWATFLAGGAS